MNEFVSHLEEKYGREIVGRLYNNGEIVVRLIRHANEADQFQVSNHILLLKEKLQLDFNVAERPWAFDFPGWTGRLDFSKDHVKKYMVIGLEPHIANFDFQITYGLSDETPVDGSKRFIIDVSKQTQFIHCRNDSSTIWTNLFRIFADERTYAAVTVHNDLEALSGFLNQFYITDLCHFAPQGKANEIKQVDDWNKIRYKVANHFLKKEVCLVRPEIIITQGTIVFDSISKILGVDSAEAFRISVGRQNFEIKYRKSEKVKILCLPHLGSLMINRTFWTKNMETVKAQLRERKFLD